MNFSARLQPLQSSIHGHTSSLSARLYHYSDLGGLESHPFDQRSLWLTLFLPTFSNDRRGNDARSIEYCRANLKSAEGASRFIAPQVTLKRSNRILNEPLADGVYICCLCREGQLCLASGVVTLPLTEQESASELAHQQILIFLTFTGLSTRFVALYRKFLVKHQQRNIISKAI